MRLSAGKCVTQRTASPLVSTNSRHLVEGPIALIFYHVRTSTFHHYDRSMYVYGLSHSYILQLQHQSVFHDTCFTFVSLMSLLDIVTPFGHNFPRLLLLCGINSHTSTL